VPEQPSAAQQAGRRAGANTILRAVAELLGKLASLVLFAAMARTFGQAGLGVFVFAFAAVQIALVPVDLGFDRYLLREVAVDRQRASVLASNIVALKLALAVPVFATAFIGLQLLDYGATTRHAAYVLAVGLLLESLARTAFAVFMAIERGGLLAVVVIVQRFAAAGLGLAALAAGYGVVAVSVAYGVAAALGLALALVLTTRALGNIAFALDRGLWRTITAASLPFALQDVFVLLLFKLDAVLLSFLSTDAAVGRYGAAYRLFESTLFIVYAFSGAFGAMYAYLGTGGTFTVQTAFERSIKAITVTLAPIAVVLFLLAEPLCQLFFGDDFRIAGEALRVLAPAVVLLGIVALGSSLVMSRTRARQIVLASAVMVAFNVALNLVLIPRHADIGAATAMLVTELLFAGIVLVLAARVIHGLRLVPTFVGPLAGCVAMVLVMLPLLEMELLAVFVGCLAYGIALILVERRVNPGDMRFVAEMIGLGLRRSQA